MKIAVIGTRGIPNIQGGVETHCQELYPRLVRSGYDVTIIRRSCYINEDNRLSEYKGVKLKDIYAPKKKSLEAIIHSFFAIVEAKKMKADILHIHAIGPALVVPFARLLGLKVVLTHHGPDYDRQKWGRLAKTILKLGERLGVRYANEVIVISEVINQLIQQKYNRKDAHLIYNGVPEHVDEIVSTQYIQSLGLEKQQYILTMGRFVPEKGFDLLIRAFKEIQNPSIKLAIAGDADHETPYSSQLKTLAKKEGVVLTGFITGIKLQEVITHARLFILPSFHEGLPIALLEALSYQLDVLVSDIPANLEVKLPHESYFQTGSLKELVIALRQKLNKEHSLKTYDMSRYNWNTIAKQVAEVYTSV